jgi:hypothetical protein
MKSILLGAATLTLAITAASAQAPQNAAACAQMRAGIAQWIRERSQAAIETSPDEVRAMIEVRRMLGDPCYGALSPPIHAACARLSENTGRYIRNRSQLGDAVKMQEVLQTLENLKLMGEPCLNRR